MTVPLKELIQNNSFTTLNGSINNSVTSITATSGAAFPSTGNFRIKIDDELMICTARSGNTLTVTRGVEGTSAASHNSGAPIIHVLTKGGLDTLNQDENSLWGSSAPPLGLLVDTDGKTVLTTADFTWVNQGTTTATDQNGTILMEAPAASGENCRLFTRSAPSTPYSVVACFQATKIKESFESFGMGFRESSTGKLHFFAFGYDGNDPGSMAVYGFDNATTFNATVTNSTLGRTLTYITGPYLWMKIKDTGTNLQFFTSNDGIEFTQIASFSRTTHMAGGPNQVFWGINNQGSSTWKMQSRLCHWSYPDNTAPLKEQTINRGVTTLASSMDNSQTSLSATSGAVFPSTGNFRVKVEDEIMICTARSSDTLTVVRGAEGTSAASHASGLPVSQYLTSGALTRLGQDHNALFGYSSAPPLGKLVDTNGSTLLTASSFTWVNQGTSTVTDENGTVIMDVPAAGSENCRIQKRTAPSPSYSLITALQGCMIGEAFGNFGIGFRQSTSGKFIALALGFDGTGQDSGWNLAIYKFNSATSFSASQLNRTRLLWRGGNNLWFKITDNNTNLVYQYSMDGVNWLDIASEARGSFLTLNGGVTGPDEVFWYINNQGSSNNHALARLNHWSTL